MSWLYFVWYKCKIPIKTCIKFISKLDFLLEQSKLTDWGIHKISAQNLFNFKFYSSLHLNKGTKLPMFVHKCYHVLTAEFWIQLSVIRQTIIIEKLLFPRIKMPIVIHMQSQMETDMVKQQQYCEQKFNNTVNK